MNRHIAYLKYVLRHKWFVFLEGLKIGVPILMLVLHDWDKFLPDEWFPYARFFYESDGTKRTVRDKTGYYKPDDTGDAAFDYAWFLHQKRNKHHWQYWILPKDDGTTIAILMPVYFMAEMLADWRGAGRAQGTPNTLEWYTKNRHKTKLHPRTRYWIEGQLGYEPREMETVL